MTRREHSVKELHQKLTARGFKADAVSQLLVQLKNEGLQSDHRFTDSFVDSRIQKGHGLLRIKRELKSRGIADEIVETCLINKDENWLHNLKNVREKRFGKDMPSNYKEQARQSRFLQYRGFSTDQIRRLFQQSK